MKFQRLNFWILKNGKVVELAALRPTPSPSAASGDGEFSAIAHCARTDAGAVPRSAKNTT
ncbi:MAG: hypothetical protein ABUL66_02985 [Verrucomicrobiota bacterium]